MKPRGTSDRHVDRIAAALLYEGYMLYPYRPSAVKNRQRFNFGIVSPADDDACYMQTECLLRGGAATQLAAIADPRHHRCRRGCAHPGERPQREETLAGP